MVDDGYAEPRPQTDEQMPTAIPRSLSTCYGNIATFPIALCVLALLRGVVTAQDYERPQDIDGAVIYDYDPATTLGDDVFGTVIADFGDPVNGQLRCSHGGPVCMEYANGTVVAFYANTSSHNVDGWSEYAFSRDGGRTWDKYHPFPYSHEAYKKNPKRPVWIEEGLVTEKGTAVLFLTHFENGQRMGNSIVRSHDNGITWSDPVPVADEAIGYPTAVVVAGTLNYVLFDSTKNGDHELYVSGDDGQTWRKQSTLPLQTNAWYGAMCMMKDGRLLAGAYVTRDEDHFYYCIGESDGRTWDKQRKAHLDKKIRDPELAYLDGKYYLHGRSGHHGDGSHRFVLYQSSDGIRWKDGVIVSGDERLPDGYSHNCIINKYNNDVPNELMTLYSIIYSPPRTSEYVFFVKPEHPR
ncbi:MAG: sialidase family protein [Pirellulales bacterium]